MWGSLRLAQQPQARCIHKYTLVMLTPVLYFTGDLFSCDPESSLAHCVSADLHMGKGIAVLFKKKFGCVSELKRQGMHMLTSMM